MVQQIKHKKTYNLWTGLPKKHLRTHDEACRFLNKSFAIAMMLDSLMNMSGTLSRSRKNLENPNAKSTSTRQKRRRVKNHRQLCKMWCPMLGL